MYGNFCKINGCGDILNFGGFRVPKIAPHNKTLNQKETKKDQENSAQRSEENYLTNHLGLSLKDMPSKAHGISY